MTESDRIRVITDAINEARTHTKEALKALAPLTTPRPPERRKTPRKKD